MRRTKRYSGVVFSPAVIREARSVQKKLVKSDVALQYMTISLPSGEEWKYDDEEEFFSAYRSSFVFATFREEYIRSEAFELMVHGEDEYRKAETELIIGMEKREQIIRIFNIFDESAEKCKVPEKKVEKKVPNKNVIGPKIFIGHGHNNQWKELKDHLHEKHGLEVKAYEIGARAGLTVQEVLDDMLKTSSFALLVFTGEDEDAEGKMHARENVIHELGLFQGRLGRRKAIILLEEEVEEFSNIHGVNSIRFKKNAIAEVYGEVLATIKREFR